jgi:hypothetical protein
MPIHVAYSVVLVGSLLSFDRLKIRAFRVTAGPLRLVYKAPPWAGRDPFLLFY